MNDNKELSKAFNLVDEPWIGVRMLDGSSCELSLLEVLRRASDIQVLSGDVPTQDFAILRLLVAVLQRSVMCDIDVDDDPDPVEVWAALWNAGSLPVKAIERYLATWHERFYLIHARQPFMQVAGLKATNGKVGDIKKIIADLPDGHPFFTTRWGETTRSMSFAEAARWLVHCQAFDVSGIKTGVVGDPNAKNGKSYPTGHLGWAGTIGGVYAQGEDLRQTLFLNLMVTLPNGEHVDELEEDVPIWERDPVTVDTPSQPPTGPADLFTRQSRRVLFAESGGKIVGLTLTYGHKLEPQNRHNLEPMSGWKESKNQAKKQVFMPATLSSDKAMWRGLEAVLPGSGVTTVDGVAYLAPAITVWLGRLAEGEVLPSSHSIRLRACGLIYNPKQTGIRDIVDDSLLVHAVLLARAGTRLVAKAETCVADTDRAVTALGWLAANLVIASGGDAKEAKAWKQGPRVQAQARAYSALDGPFRRWLAGLGNDTDPIEAEQVWHAQADRILCDLAGTLISEAGPGAFTGHPDGSGGWMTAAKAERQFRWSLRKALPVTTTSDIDSSPNERSKQ